MKPNPRLMLTLVLLTNSLAGWAQSTTVSSNPLNGATGVSPSAPVVFTFSAAMNTSSASALFTTLPSGFYPVNSVWSAGNTVLTCTPLSPFPNDTEITWTVFGMDGTGGFVSDTGTFTTGTGTGGGGGGSGTNKITTFSAGKLYFYDQNTAGAPIPNDTAAYSFSAATSLASNVVATAATVTLPTGGAPVVLTQNFLHHEDYNFFDFKTNAAAFEAAYPQGNYVFNVTATPANLQVTVTLPQAMAQPNAPHVSNFAAAQAVNASQAFTLDWDAFQGGTASDVITVSVSDNQGKTVFATPNPGTNGALAGTATSVVIPSGKLAANTSNTLEVVFYHFVAVSNATYATIAFRATGTQLNLSTIGTAGSVPTVSNPVWSSGGFGFDVSTSPNQGLKVLYSTDCSLPTSMWQVLMTTNSPGSSVHIAIPSQVGAAGFFRLENSP